MIHMVLGTMDSGKSALAEDLALQTGDHRRYYLATMKRMDSESEIRVQKHRRQRAGKGFVTIERECDVSDAVHEIPEPSDATVLLECVANLTGNEMYRDPARLRKILSEPAFLAIFADHIAGDIKSLADSVHNLIIVTNEYACDGEGYDDETRRYVEVLHMVNEKVRMFADKVYDVRISN